MVAVAKRFTHSSFNEALATIRGATPAAAFYTLPTPAELHSLYRFGFRGIRPENATHEQKDNYKTLMAAMPRLYDVFPWARGLGKGKLSLPYLAVLKFSPTWGGDEAQTRGSCTVHSTANSGEVDHANDAAFGETKYMGRLVKENIYRSRGFSSDGWSCTAPATYVGPTGRGGFLYRKLYTGPNGEKVDFTKFSRDTENWAGNGRAGVPKWLEEESAKNKAKWIIPITTMEEYRDAIALGFGISICSGQGFSATTDEYGVAMPEGSWSHAMAHAGCDDRPWAHTKYGDLIGLDIQSWGRWNKQNGMPEGVKTMPIGSFWIKANTIANKMLGEDDVAICNVYGWERAGWEAFDTLELKKHLANSTTQDYYKNRAEKIEDLAVRAYDENLFLAI